MGRYLLQRIGLGLAALVLIATATFFLMHAVPGDPLRQEKAVPEEIRKNLEEHYGLNRPLHEQYLSYMTKMFLKGDFGISFKQAHRSVNSIIRDHFWISAVVGLCALGFASLVGVFLGALAAVFHNRPLDHLGMVVAVVGVSMPSFVLAYLMQYALALRLQWLPVGGWDGISSVVLPAVSLGMIVMASMARITRSSMLEVKQQDYIRTARAKGLLPLTIILRHQVRNALLPVFVFLGPQFAIVMTGSFVVESIFGIPGLGQFFVNSVRELDYTVIMGLTVFYAGFAIFMSIAVDFLYSFIDPRIRVAT